MWILISITRFRNKKISVGFAEHYSGRTSDEMLAGGLSSWYLNVRVHSVAWAGNGILSLDCGASRCQARTWHLDSSLEGWQGCPFISTRWKQKAISVFCIQGRCCYVCREHQTCNKRLLSGEGHTSWLSWSCCSVLRLISFLCNPSWELICSFIAGHQLLWSCSQDERAGLLMPWSCRSPLKA